MPELPETETIARDLHDAVAGDRIVGATVTRPDVLREIAESALGPRLAGATIERAWRRAKLIVLDFGTGDRLVVQPRFTGALLIDEAGSMPDAQRRYSTLALHLETGRAIHYRDIRRLGTVSVMAPPRWEAYSSALGIEPLGDAFTVDALSGILRVSRQAVKKVVMDQRMVVGVGNIYANESLWAAGIDPSREARSLDALETNALHGAIVDVLSRSIAARGTSFRDYVDARGGRGAFVEQLQAYGRGGAPCTRCGARLIDTSAVDGRTTVFCARCQR